jgi:hypothetical protein
MTWSERWIGIFIALAIASEYGIWIAVIWVIVLIVIDTTWEERMSAFNNGKGKPWDKAPTVVHGNTRVLTPEVILPGDEPSAPDSWLGRRKERKREEHKSEITRIRGDRQMERIHQAKEMMELRLWYQDTTNELERGQMELERDREQRGLEALQYQYTVEEFYHLKPMRIQQTREREELAHREAWARSERVIKEEEAKYEQAEADAERGRTEQLQAKLEGLMISRKISHLDSGLVEKLFDAKITADISVEERRGLEAQVESMSFRQDIKDIKGINKQEHPGSEKAAKLREAKVNLEEDLREFRKAGIKPEDPAWENRLNQYYSTIQEITS